MNSRSPAARLLAMINVALAEADRQQKWLVGVHLSTARDELRRTFASSEGGDGGIENAGGETWRD